MTRKNCYNVSMTTKVNNAACDRCGACIGVCPANALLLLSASLEVDGDRCTGCGRCIKICPFGALALVDNAEGNKNSC